jgi:hypothetical protein
MFSIIRHTIPSRLLLVGFIHLVGAFLLAEAHELTRCRVCFGKVSVNAKACVHCGEPKFSPRLALIEEDELQDRLGVFYAINGEEPFTGLVVEGRYTNGVPKARQEYKAGKRDGQRMKWYENGQVMQISFYEDGKLHGLMEEWYENGLRMAQGTYGDGKLQGVVRRWHISGELEAEYPYKDGELHGILIQWSRQGRMISKKEYEDGKIKARLEVDLPSPKENPDQEPTTPTPEPQQEDQRSKRFDDLKKP